MAYGKLGTYNKFLAELAGVKNSTVCLVIIQNMQMLLLAYGQKKTDGLIRNFCRSLEEAGQVFRIQHNQIALICPQAAKAANKAIKKIADGWVALETKETGHIVAIFGSEFISRPPQDAETWFTGLYGKVLRNDVDMAHILEDDESLSSTSQVYMQLTNELTKAINEKRLRLVFQPIISAENGKPAFYEALLRIRDAKGNLRSAGSFIPIAEKMGIIQRIDMQVLELVISELERYPGKILSFNISSLTIGDKAWTKKFFERVTPEIASRMVVEITETAVMRDLRETSLFITSLQEVGVQVALDDFGSGYTSFRQIRQLSLDYVKIDGSLIHDLVNNHHNNLLVKSLMKFLKGLGLKTIAEHVDGGSTAKLLISYGIDYMQGNYFGAAA